MKITRKIKTTLEHPALSILYQYDVLLCAQSLQSCLTLCDPIDDLLPGSSVSEILQARTLKWVAIAFSNA